MITLPLFPHESLAARRIANPSVTTWIPRSGGLPEDGDVVYAYVPSIQLKRGSGPQIHKYFIRDRMWAAEWSFERQIANWKEDRIECSPTPQSSRRRLQMTLAF